MSKLFGDVVGAENLEWTAEQPGQPRGFSNLLKKVKKEKLQKILHTKKLKKHIINNLTYFLKHFCRYFSTKTF